MNYRGYMRKKLLEKIYDQLSDEEKQLYIQMSIQDKDHREIMEALQQQRSDLELIKRKQNWVTDFGSDVAANFLTDGLIWLGSKLFKLK